MSNKDIIAKIKAEIERRMDKHWEGLPNADAPEDDWTHNELCELGAYKELEHLETFLSTLESETTYDTQQYTPRPSVGIEDVARVQFASHAKIFDKKRKAVFNWEQFKEVAGIFYGFGKKDRTDTLESKKPMNQEGLEEEIVKVCDDFVFPLYGLDDEFGRELINKIAHHFAQWGYLRAAEKYDEIEYNRQRAEEDTPNDLEKAAHLFSQSPEPLYSPGHRFHWDGDALFGKQIETTFIAGAKWQERKDEEEQADLFTIVALDAAQRAKEQMLKGAVKWLVDDDYHEATEKGRFILGSAGIGYNGYYIPYSDLLKLPKEDGK